MAISRKYAVLGALLTGTLAFTACSGGNSGSPEAADASADFGYHATGFPIVSKQLTLKFSGTKTALAPDYNTMTVVKNWEKDTNIHIDWQNLPETVFQEKKNLILASGDLPDAFFNSRPDGCRNRNVLRQRHADPAGEPH